MLNKKHRLFVCFAFISIIGSTCAWSSRAQDTPPEDSTSSSHPPPPPSEPTVLDKVENDQEWKRTILCPCGRKADREALARGNTFGAIGTVPLRRERNFTGFSAYADQDVFLINGNEDRNYTMGVSLEASGDWIRIIGLHYPLWLIDCPLQINKLHLKHSLGTRSFSFGVSAFTPDDLSVSTPIHGDRPYSSLIAITTRWTTVNETNDFALTSELSIGLLGLRLAERVQTLIHQASRSATGKETPYDPKGWTHQISDGGEPTLRYGLSGQWLLANIPVKNGSIFDLKFTGELNAGYYTNAASGAAFRIGKIASPFWAHKTNPLGGQNEVVQPAVNASKQATKQGFQWDLYAWAGFRTRAVIYNVLLQGQFRNSPVTFNAKEIERLIFEHEIGVTLDLHGIIWVTWVPVAGRSREYKGDFSRHHYWSSVWAGWHKAF